MLKHILLITLRNYRKNLLFTLIIVFGLSVSIATILVICRYVIQEYRTDTFHKEYNNIYMVMGISPERSSSIVKEDWAEKFKSGYPQVKEACRMDRIRLDVIHTTGPIKLNNVLSTDPSFFKIFSFPVIKGDQTNPLKESHSIVITESIAKKLFGKEDPLGKVIKTKIDADENLLTVTAVTKDPPENSMIQFEALVSFECKSFHYHSMSFSSKEKGIYQTIYLCDTYLLIHNKANIQWMNDRLKKESYMENKDLGYFYFLQLHPYSEAYFDKNQADSFRHGDKKMLFVFLSLAILLILLACINYINLTTIKAFSRGREIAYKKVSGASRRLLTGQFLFESVGLSILAFILAIGMAKYMADAFGKLVNSSVDVSWFFRSPQIFWVLLISVALGLISGYFPAMYLSRLKTSELFKGQSVTARHHLLLPKNLFIFQFTIAIALMISAMFIGRQLNYINNKNLGFDVKQMMHLSLPPDVKPFALKAELLKNPGITNITLSYGTPGKISYTSGKYSYISIDSSFLSTFGITLVAGRNISPGDKNVCLVNETLMRENEWYNYKGKTSGDYEIIGVVKDFHTSSLYDKIVPVEMDYNTSFLPDLTIKMNSTNMAGTLDFIKTTWKKMAPYSPMDYYFYDEWVNRQYKKEEAFGSLISVFTLIAIIISCLGLFGLLAYLIERRSKEIGIRKINGAAILEIMVLLNKDFVKWVGISFFLAIPIAWLVLYKWLENFAYKTKLDWWFFTLGGIIALVIALLTVSWKSWFAARRNPAEVIREE